MKKESYRLPEAEITVLKMSDIITGSSGFYGEEDFFEITREYVKNPIL